MQQEKYPLQINQSCINPAMALMLFSYQCQSHLKRISIPASMAGIKYITLVKNMHVVRSLLLHILIYFSPLLIFAQKPTAKANHLQNKRIDSLLIIINESGEDRGKANQLFELGLLLEQFKLNDEILKYGSEALSLSLKINYKRGIGLSHYLISLHYFLQTNYTEAKKDIFTASAILEEEGDKENFGKCLNLIAAIFFRQANYPESINYYKKTIAILEETGNKTRMPYIYNKMGECASYLGNLSECIDYHFKALKYSEELKDRKGVAAALHSIGITFWDLNDDSLGLKNVLSARKINLELGDKFACAQNNNTIGDYFLKSGRYAEALKYFYESIKIYEEPGAPGWGTPWAYACLANAFDYIGDSALQAGNKQAAANMYQRSLENNFISLRKWEQQNEIHATAEQKIYIGSIYIKLNKIQDAKRYLQAGLQTLQQLGVKEYIGIAYRHLSHIDSLEGNYEKAFANYKLYIVYRDSVFNAEESRKVELYKTQFEFEKKEQELKLLSAENELKTITAEKQNQQKKFAYGLIVAVLLLSGYGFYRYRRRSLMKSEQRMLRERLLISQDLHDNVGSTLSSISVFSKVAQMQNEDNNKEELQDILEKINITSGDMVAEMNDTVWAINPRNDSMEKIIQRMESFARPLLAIRNISFACNYDPSIFTTNLGMEKRKNFYFIFKEAVNNAYKYSGCSVITVFITNTGKHIELVIKDDGIGFDLQHEMKENKLSLSGNGLRNMQARADEMKGNLMISSEPGKGTEIKLGIPIP